MSLDFLIPYEWNGEFYLSEPKTISSISDDKEKVYMEINSRYSALKDSFKFKQLLKHYKEQEINHLLLYLLENDDFYNFDMDFSDYAYNIQSLDKNGNYQL